MCRSCESIGVLLSHGNTKAMSLKACHGNLTAYHGNVTACHGNVTKISWHVTACHGNVTA